MRSWCMARLAAGCALVCLAVSPALAAPRLFGTTGSRTTVSTLVELDPATGALLQTIGSVGYTVNGLTYDVSTGKLWGSTSTNAGFLGLIEINMVTGAGTPVGSGWNIGDSQTIVCITSNASGAIYGWREPSVDCLVSINKALGTCSNVGDPGLGTGALGLSFSNNGTLYLYNYSGAYYTVSTTTGAATPVGSLGGVAHHGDFNPTSNIYYGIDTTYDPPRRIRMLDLINGVDLGSMATVDNLHTLTFAPDAVPEAGTLAALSGFLTSGGLWLWRRRRTA